MPMSPRLPLIAANWKMHKTAPETEGFVLGLKAALAGPTGREVVLAPPFPSLAAASAAARGSEIKIAAQNMHWEEKGAYTGEVSARMLADAGCSYVIIGHSERRRLFFETDGDVNRKIIAGLQGGLDIIVCIGETIEERDGGEAFKVLKRQLNQALKNVPMGDINRVSVAYEPVWAIGTGKTATPAQAAEAHALVRSELAAAYSGQCAQGARIIYGGSVTPENIKGLMAEPDINGALVGGASLELESFLRIVRF